MTAGKRLWRNRKERKEWARRLQSEDPGLEVVHPHAAGIDVGNSAHYVAVRPERDPQPVRRFECFTADLHRLADWLQSCGVKTVALHSTGVYRIPLYDVLEERGFEVYLVNARHTKNLPGRQSDVQGRKSPFSCGISQRFDSIAKVSECTDHSHGAGSPGLFGNCGATFLVANPFMQNDPDQPTQAMCNCPNGFIVS